MFKYVTTVQTGSITASKKQIEFSTRPHAESFYGIRYYDVVSVLLDRLYALLPTAVHNDFYSSLLVINDDIPPHTDIVETAGLNCYVHPGNYTTNFYESLLGAKRITYADHGEGHIYDKSQLTLLGSFQARPFDVYLINNKVIHEVITTGIDKPLRQVLQLATNKHSFDQVCKMIKIPK